MMAGGRSYRTGFDLGRGGIKSCEPEIGAIKTRWYKSEVER
jgi:hypothetical protein